MEEFSMVRDVPVFVASSVREFEREREEIAVFFDELEQVHEGIRLRWYRPETMFRGLVRGGSQLPYDEKIRTCRFFILLVGKQLGKHTVEEFDLALEQFRKTGAPVILPYFLDVRATREVLDFQERIRKDLDIDEQYVDPYGSFDKIFLRLHIDLIRCGAFKGGAENRETADREAAARKGLDGIRELIREQQERAEAIQAEPVTPQTLMKLTETYEEIRRLVREYRVEPEALKGYLAFLWKQHLYDTGIELGQKMEALYCLEEPDDAEWAWLENEMGMLLSATNRMEEAEECYREALKLYRRLAEGNPAAYEPDVAMTCNNLGILLKDTNRMEEAEERCREALSIRRRLAEENPTSYEPYVAETLNNLGTLLQAINRMEEAEERYREALSIQRRLVEGNPGAYEPDVAMTCNNLGAMLSDTNRMEEAEERCREALSIWRRLTEGNPGAYEPYVATTCNNLGLLLKVTNRMGEAEDRYREALSIRRRLTEGNPGVYEPDVAATCHNLGILLSDTNRMEEAEERYREALSIRRRLAEENPGAYEPDLADTAYNLGLLKRSQSRRDDARHLFQEALGLYEKYPHRAKDAQDAREQLESL